VSGHGYDLDTLAGDIVAVAGHLGLDDAVLIGHSLGAAEAIRYLAADPGGRIAGLVLSAPSAPILRQAPDNPHGIPSEVFHLARQMLHDDSGAATRATTTEDFLGPGHAVSALLDDAARRQFVDLPLQVLLATFDTNAEADLRADLASIGVPTLIIQGDADKNNPLELTGRRTVELIPDAKLVILNGAGHGLYRSEARRYTAEMVNFAHSLPARLPR
jgi:non-heme chloroperoxidase